MIGIYPVFAYVMESGNYRIQSDSLNIGGTRQTSDNYISRDTIGEIATGPSQSSSYKLYAGYQEMQEVYLSVSSPADATMSASIPGITGNPGQPTTADVTWTVKTDNAAGFTMSIVASSDPAMRMDNTWTFSDYTVAAGTTPDYSWATPSVSVAEFGYSVYPASPTSTVSKFLDNGSSICGTGSTNGVDTCWYPLATIGLTIINRSTRTSSAGEADTVKFKAQSNAKFLKQGWYGATITVTIAAN